MLASHGVIVLVPVIAPYAAARDLSEMIMVASPCRSPKCMSPHRSKSPRLVTSRVSTLGPVAASSAVSQVSTTRTRCRPRQSWWWTPPVLILTPQ